MSKCVGNCAICTLEIKDKIVCCQIQTLRNIVEIKAMLKEMKEENIKIKEDMFTDILTLDTEDIADDNEPTVSGTD